MVPGHFSFIRYLEAKKSVDDRALNRLVWETLSQALAEYSRPDARPLKVLETGAGIGTMLERIFDWGLLEPELFGEVSYTAVDADAHTLMNAGHRLHRWALARGYQIQTLPNGNTPWIDNSPGESLLPASSWVLPMPAMGNPWTDSQIPGLCLEMPGQEVRVRLQASDILEFAARPENQGESDLLIAHAFLDLLYLPTALPALLSLLRPGGLFYFTLNFDEATLLEPVIDPELDELIQSLYHRTMDERMTDGKPSGDSRTGRHLFQLLNRCGARILAAGASDWVVFAGKDGYPGEEAYFLHFILHTIEEALKDNSALDAKRFSGWIAERHAQVERGELAYIAHQLDFMGRIPG